MTDVLCTWRISLCLALAATSSGQLVPCGRIQDETPLFGRRIVGGTEAKQEEFPWQVGLRSFGPTFCSGVLIAKDWVLTAGRCFDGHYDPTSWIVVLGDYDRGRLDGTEMRVHVRNIVIHGGFTMDPYSNDVALVQLVNHDIDYPFVCLPGSNTDLLGSSCVITGWGATHKGDDLAYKLQKLPMNVVNASLCLLPSNTRSADYLCAVSDVQGGGPCSGDAGGALQCRLGSVWVAAGIVLDTYACGNTTELYTNVKSYLPWIQKTMTLLNDAGTIQH
ncbi:transmembrane protease serine 11D-like isoform X2 [Haliotis rubra]|uniref:transmembrane protease serine 11D-like isoform X2 n=1 Tax=Haliotis rubra TaxID=36100 RepID=UPI001EE55FCC|nr:transmembrane protease serine 11D-like isoform X2 [Haliotis rubra]